jgi:hypothetical protein
MRYDIIRNERAEDRLHANGCIRKKHCLTWDVVKDGVLYMECKTRKEAVREAKALNATISREDGRTPIAAVKMGKK